MSHPLSSQPTRKRERKRKPKTSDFHLNKRTRVDCWGTPYGCRITQPDHICKHLPPKQTPQEEQTRQEKLWRRLYHYLVEASEDTAARRCTLAEPNTEGSALPHALQVLKGRAGHLLGVPYFEQIPDDRTDAAYNLPFTFNTNNCWTNPPTLDQMDDYLLQPIKKALGTIRSRVMFQQLSLDRDSDLCSQPKPRHAFWEVERCIDLIPSEAMHIDHPFTLPDWMTAGINQYTYNVTPRHSFADLHADEGCGVLAWPRGSVKIWITFGPEKRVRGNSGNKSLERDDKFFGSLLETMMRESGITDARSESEQSSAHWPSHIIHGDGRYNASQFSLMSPRLPHKIYIACTEDNKGLYLPPGWKHVVYTLRGGYLGGLTFVPKPEHLLSHASGMMRALNLSTMSDHQRERRALFLRFVELARKAIFEVKNIEPATPMITAHAERLKAEMWTAVESYRGSQKVVSLLNSLIKIVAAWQNVDEPSLFELQKVEKPPTASPDP